MGAIGEKQGALWLAARFAVAWQKP